MIYVKFCSQNVILSSNKIHSNHKCETRQPYLQNQLTFTKHIQTLISLISKYIRGEISNIYNNIIPLLISKPGRPLLRPFAQKSCYTHLSIARISYSDQLRKILRSVKIRKLKQCCTQLMNSSSNFDSFIEFVNQLGHFVLKIILLVEACCQVTL